MLTMKLVFVAFPLLAITLFAAVKSPDERVITDPKSLTSRVNPKAGPITIDDLFYTRQVVGPAWSPDGREIVFTTNLTGRLNLWKVPADGDGPSSCRSPTIVNRAPPGRLTGNGLFIKKIMAGENIMTFSPCPPMEAKPLI